MFKVSGGHSERSRPWFGETGASELASERRVPVMRNTVAVVRNGHGGVEQRVIHSPRVGHDAGADGQSTDV